MTTPASPPTSRLGPAMVLEPQPQLVALTIVLYIGNDREGCPLHVEQAKWLVILQKCTLCTLKHSKINDTLALIIIHFTAFWAPPVSFFGLVLLLHNHGGVSPSGVPHSADHYSTATHDGAKGKAAAPHQRYDRRDCRKRSIIPLIASRLWMKAKRIREGAPSGGGRTAPSTGWADGVYPHGLVRTNGRQPASTSTATVITHLSFHDNITPSGKLGIFFSTVDVSHFCCPYQPFSTKRVTSECDICRASQTGNLHSPRQKQHQQQQRSILLPSPSPPFSAPANATHAVNQAV